MIVISTNDIRFFDFLFRRSFLDFEYFVEISQRHDSLKQRNQQKNYLQRSYSHCVVALLFSSSNILYCTYSFSPFSPTTKANEPPARLLYVALTNHLCKEERERERASEEKENTDNVGLFCYYDDASDNDHPCYN